MIPEQPAPQDPLVPAFIAKMKGANLELPPEQYFSVQELPKNVKALATSLLAENLPLDFWYDASMIYYCLGIQPLAQELLNLTLDLKMSQPVDAPKTTKIKILISLSAFYLKKAIISSDQQVRDELFKKLKSNLNRSDKIKINEKTSFMLKGYYYFFIGEIKQSVSYFDNAKDTDPNYIPCIIGKACIEYFKKNYVDALELFKQALRLNPQNTFSLRLGLAYCYYQLDDIKLATLAFETCLARKEDCIEAKLGLAVIANREGDLQKYYSLLFAVFKEQPTNIPALIAICEMYFFKGEYERTKKMAEYGLSIIDSKIYISGNSLSNAKIDIVEIKSKFYYILAFIAHSQMKKDPKKSPQEAFKLYQKSVETFPHNFPAQFGLGQLHTASKNYESAINCFKKIVKNKTEAEACGCFKIMAYTYSRLKNKRKESQSYYELSMKYFPEDVGLLMEYAMYLQSFNVQRSLEVYRKVQALQKIDPSISVHPEFYINLGVTLLKNNKLEESLEASNQALKMLVQGDNEIRCKTLYCITVFNKGKVLQKMAHFKEAIECFTDLKEKYPIMQESFLMLADIYFQQQDFEKTFQYCDEAIEAVLKQPKLNRRDIPYCLKAYYYIQIDELEKALEVLQLLERQLKQKDPYAMLLIANINYRQSCLLRDKVVDQKKMINYAMQKCYEVLKRKEEECNLYVGLTMASLFAEKARFQFAIKVLNCAQESSSSNPKVLYNLAYLNHLMGNYEKSLTILVSYRQKHSSNLNEDIQILFGINNFFLRNYKDAISTFKRLVIQYPENHAYLYNYAAMMHEIAKRTFKVSQKASTASEQLVTASSYLELAKRIYKRLLSNIKQQAKEGHFEKTWSEEKRKRALYRTMELREKSMRNLNFIEQNEETYKILKQKDKEQTKKKNSSKEIRNKIFQKQESKNKMIQEEEVRQLEEENAEMERIALEDRLKTEEIVKSFKEDKLNVSSKSKRIKKNKNMEVVDSNTGDMPMLDFGERGEEGVAAENTFDDLYHEGSFKFTKTQKTKTGKKKGKRLVKQSQLENEKAKASEGSDIDLDLHSDSDGDGELQLAQSRNGIQSLVLSAGSKINNNNVKNLVSYSQNISL